MNSFWQHLKLWFLHSPDLNWRATHSAGLRVMETAKDRDAAMEIWPPCTCEINRSVGDHRPGCEYGGGK